jgi:arylsulfatase A-like enzyme
MDQSRLSFLLAALTLTLGLAGAWPAPAQPTTRPNILLVIIDDMNDWGMSELKAREGVVHPNLDKLAARGMLFTNAHCAAPACSPSRTAIITGVAPYRSGVYTNSHDWRSNDRLRGQPTVFEAFRAAGYRVTGGGKIFHCEEWATGPVNGYNDPRCWDEFFPSITQPLLPKVWPPNVPLAKGTGQRIPIPQFDWGPVDEPIEKMPDHQVVDWAISELQKKHDRPFFQAVGIYRPHIPWYVPRQFFDLYPLDKIELPYVKPGWRDQLPPAARNSGAERRRWHQWVVNNDQWRAAVQGYMASISFADFQVGRLLDALQASSHRDNTIVVLATDHGFHLGDKDTWEKFTLWAESTRVPFVIAAPGVTRPGENCARPVSLLDIYPTLLELAGLPANPRNDGLSLVPWLKEPTLPRDRPAIITNERNNHAVRDDRYHYIRYANGDEELYDMATDEGQWTNLANDPAHAAVKEGLRARLPTENVPPQPATPSTRPARGG